MNILIGTTEFFILYIAFDLLFVPHRGVVVVVTGVREWGGGCGRGWG